MQSAAAALALYTLTSLASLWPVLVHPGWPSNHDALAMRFRTLVYAAHFARGDWLPIWSAEDFDGLGTPMPFFYHKLFFALAGALQALFGSVKAALVVSLLLLMIAGCWGLERALRRLDVPRPTAVLVAAALPLQAYTLCEWLIRGALAELSASMLVPWLLLALLVAIREGRAPALLVASLALLALAHAALAYAALGLALLGAGFALAGAERARFLAGSRRAAWLAAACLVLAAPWLAIYLRLRPHYGVGAAASGLYDPLRHLQGFARGFLSDGRWTWGESERWTPTALNPETLAFLALALAGIALSWRRSAARGDPARRALAFVAVATVAFALLQLPLAAPAYTLVPGLRLLQFPWRLMAIVQTLVLALVGAGLARLAALRPSPLVRRLPVLFLAASLVASRSFHPIRYPWYPSEALEAALAPGAERGVPGMGEYLPRVDAPGLRGGPLARYWLALGRREDALGRQVDFEGEAARGGCSGAALERPRAEPRELVFLVRCPAPATAILRQHHSGLERVELATARGPRSAAARRSPSDPRIRVEVPAGVTRIRVELPDFWSALLPVRTPLPGRAFE